MMGKTNSLTMLTKNPIMSILKLVFANVVANNLKLFCLFFLKVVQIEFIQSFFCLELFQVPTKLDFPYL